MEAEFLMSFCKWLEEMNFKSITMVTSSSKIALNMPIKLNNQKYQIL